MTSEAQIKKDMTQWQGFMVAFEQALIKCDETGAAGQLWIETDSGVITVKVSREPKGMTQ